MKLGVGESALFPSASARVASFGETAFARLA
jgi:hypothetical protein